MFKDLLQVQNLIKDAREASDNLIIAQPDSENLINVQTNEIFLISESLREPLLNVANKLLGRQRLSFEQLTPSEKELWTKFETSDIYKFLTGETNTVPEFCHNWLTFSAKPKVNIDIDKIAQSLTPIPVDQLPPAIQRASSAPSPPTHNLRERKGKIDYKALHLGQQIKSDIQQAAQEVKQKCKQMKKPVRKSAKATVTKLAPGAFSPKQPAPASHLPLHGLHLLLPGHSGPQNRQCRRSSGSGTETARLKLCRAEQITTPVQAFRKMRSIHPLHSH